MVTTAMPDGSPLSPDLFLFTDEELVLSPDMARVLVPPHLSGQSHHYIPPNQVTNATTEKAATATNVDANTKLG